MEYSQNSHDVTSAMMVSIAKSLAVLADHYVEEKDEREHGEWIYVKDEDTYKCNKCHYPCHHDRLGAIPTAYCANCGLIMDIKEGEVEF